MKTVTKKTVERGRLSGEGLTLTEAKLDLNRKVDAALEGSYEPKLITHGQWTVLLHRQPQGWCYILLELAPVSEPGVHDRFCIQSPRPYRECFQDAASHLLGIASGLDEFHTDADIPDFLTDRGKRDTLLGNARFHRAYAFARTNHADQDSNWWHRWAGDNERDPRFA